MTETGPRAPRLRTGPRMRELRFDGGSLSLDLSATVGRRASVRVERLTGPERLERWCEGVGIVPAPGGDPQALLVMLRELREAVYDVLSSPVTGRRPAAASVELVNRRAQGRLPLPRLELAADGVRTAGPGPLGPDALLAAVARDAVALLDDDGRRSRLRLCAFDICGMVYLEPGHGRARKWCSMSLCGNVAKAAGHRRRAAAADDGTLPGA